MGKVFCIVIIALAFSLYFSDLAGRTWYILPNGTGEAPTIQAGIDSAAVGDTVLLAPGTYIGDGNRDIDFYGLAIVVKSELGPEITIIDCEATAIDLHRGFYFHNGEDSMSIVEGITIINGYVSGTDNFYGGAIYCISSSPTIKDNTIKNNSGNGSGCGIFCRHSSAKILNNRIRDNAVGFGSGCGVYCDSSSVIIGGNIISQNVTQSGNGGGICCSDGYYEITHNTIDSNYAVMKGGGIYCNKATAVIANNRITYNDAYMFESGNGGGINLLSGSYIVEEDTISYNFSPQGGGIYCDACSVTTVIRNNFISDNEGYFAGGGIDCRYCTIDILDNKIISNSAETGGGIHCQSASPNIIGNEIRGNIGGNMWIHSGGGGIYCYNTSSPLIEYNVIYENYSYTRGGGIYCRSSSPTISHCNILSNIAQMGATGDGIGSGIYCETNSNPLIENCIVAFNTYSEFGDEGYGIYSEDATSLPTIYCCDVYGNEHTNYGGALSDQTGINGNISVDPLFCYPDEYDYHLQFNSPCVPGNHPDGYSCGLIGALGIGCGAEEPYIIGIEDIGNDQGRQVNISWYASRLDTAGSAEPIQTYEVYRRIDDLPIPPVGFVEDGLTTTDSERILSLTYPPGDWHYIFDVPAHGEKTYHVVAPTLEDSCVYNTTDYYSVFFIRATTATPTNYYESPIDSGYSVDNLAPGVPSGFMVAYLTGSNELIWDESDALDFQCFRIYRGENPDFDPLPENLVHMNVGTSWTDTAEDCWRYVYKITAVDHAGNESEATCQEPITNTDVPTVPDAYVLYQNVPNPFNPTTTIKFDLPVRSHARLSIYNVKGQLIRVLLDRDIDAGSREVRWDGRDSKGRGVASGIYFYRLDTPAFSESRKMILLR